MQGADRFDDPVTRFRDTVRFTREHGPCGSFGISGIGLAVTAAVLTVHPTDLDDSHARRDDLLGGERARHSGGDAMSDGPRRAWS